MTPRSCTVTCLINFHARLVLFESSGFYFDSVSLLAANAISSYSFQARTGQERQSPEQKSWSGRQPLPDGSQGGNMWGDSSPAFVPSLLPVTAGGGLSLTVPVNAI